MNSIRAVSVLSSRFDDAMVFASELHRYQIRKGSGTPYMAHLLGVAALVIENGGDEDAAIAALLHDASEDQGGLPTLEKISERFGERVAQIVAECSDNEGEPKRPWKERKIAFIDRIATLSARARLVALSDKLHNVRSLLADYVCNGEQVWSNFNGGREGTAWYYRASLEAFKRTGNEPLVAQLETAVNLFLQTIEECKGRRAGALRMAE